MNTLLLSVKTHSSSLSVSAIGASGILPKGTVADSQEKNYTHTTQSNSSAIHSQLSGLIKQAFYDISLIPHGYKFINNLKQCCQIALNSTKTTSKPEASKKKDLLTHIYSRFPGHKAIKEIFGNLVKELIRLGDSPCACIERIKVLAPSRMMKADSVLSWVESLRVKKPVPVELTPEEVKEKELKIALESKTFQLKSNNRSQHHKSRTFNTVPTFYTNLDNYYIGGKQYTDPTEGMERHNTLYYGLNFDTEFADLLAQAMDEGLISADIVKFLSFNQPDPQIIKQMVGCFSEENLQLLTDYGLLPTSDALVKAIDQEHLPQQALEQLYLILSQKKSKIIIEQLILEGLVTIPDLSKLKRKLVSKQYRQINTPLGSGTIYSDHPRHKSYHSIGEWGNEMGIELIPNPTPDERYKKTIIVVVYSHFQTAEIEYFFNGQWRKQWVHDVLTNSSEIKATKRLQAASILDKNGNSIPRKTVQFNPVCGQLEDGTLVNIDYRLVDTAGLHGVAGYKDLLKNTGVKADDKELNFLCAEELQKQDKIPADVEVTNKNADQLALETLGYVPITNMLRTRDECPESFDRYAKGDLYVSYILDKYAELYQIVEKDLGLPPEWYTRPKLTIGATVALLIEKAIAKWLGLNWLDKKERDKVHDLLKATCPKKLIETTTTEFLNAKTFGGRCYNNKPTVQLLEGIIIDDDEDGCYGNGQLLQDICFGSPDVMRFIIEDDNQYPTLRKWLKDYKDELVPGCWQAFIGFKEGYIPKWQQDFFLSWVVSSRKFNFSVYKKWLMRNAREEESLEKQGMDTKFLKDGYTKFHLEEIRCALFNHDALQWLDYVCSPQQKSELLDNLVVYTSQVYLKSMECADYSDYLEKVDEYESVKRGTTSKRKKKIRSLENDEHTYWFRKNLGDLLTAKLICQRKRYPKKPSKHPLNTLYKLIINTIYGVFASSYFKVSNSMVGNGITMRARAFGWYFEKACNAHGIVTDGGILDPNYVVFERKHKINGVNMIDGRGLRDGKKSLMLKPLFGKRLEFSHVADGIRYYRLGEELLSYKELTEKLDSHAVINHMRSQFSDKIDALNIETKRVKPKFKKDANGNVIKDAEGVAELVDGDYCGWKDAKGYFDWEIKDIYDKAHLHGLSNYLLIKEDQDPDSKEDQDPDSKDKLAMRSYNERDHFEPDGGKAEKSPAREFMESLKDEIIPVPKPYYTTQILKLTAFQTHVGKYLEHDIAPGDSVAKVVQVTPFSKSGFKFLNSEQLLEWDCFMGRSKENLGWSFERFWLVNKDGTEYDPDIGGEPFINYTAMNRWAHQAIMSGKSKPWKDLPNYEKFKDYKSPYYHLKVLMKRMTEALATKITWKEAVDFANW